MVCTWYALRLDPRRVCFAVPHGYRGRVMGAPSCVDNPIFLYSLQSMVQQAISLVGVKAVFTFVRGS